MSAVVGVVVPPLILLAIDGLCSEPPGLSFQLYLGVCLTGLAASTIAALLGWKLWYQRLLMCVVVWAAFAIAQCGVVVFCFMTNGFEGVH